MKRNSFFRIGSLIFISMAFFCCSEEDQQDVILSASEWKSIQESAETGMPVNYASYTSVLNSIDLNNEKDVSMLKSLQDQVDHRFNEANTLFEKRINDMKEESDSIDKLVNLDLENGPYSPRGVLSKYLPDMTISTANGIVGYVDLGLPSGTKWAVMNLGTYMKKAERNFSYYFDETAPKEPVVPTSKPQTTDLLDYIKAKAAEETSSIDNSNKTVRIPYNTFMEAYKKANIKKVHWSDFVSTVVKDEILGQFEEDVSKFSSEVIEYQRASYSYKKNFEQGRKKYELYVLSTEFPFTLDRGVLYEWGSSSFSTQDKTSEMFPAANDFASILLGSNWSVPTREQVEELINNCTFTRETIDNFHSTSTIVFDSNATSNGKIDGYEVKGPNGKSIFFIREWKSMINLRDIPNNYGESCFYYFDIDSKSIKKTNRIRLQTFVIRPVYKTN